MGKRNVNNDSGGMKRRRETAHSYHTTCCNHVETVVAVGVLAATYSALSFSTYFLLINVELFYKCSSSHTHF